MKVYLDATDGRRHRLATPEPGSPEAVAEHLACPKCRARPLRVSGRGIRETTRDSYVADARCVACGADAGTLRAVTSTIFGIEEDERVLVHGRARVY